VYQFKRVAYPNPQLPTQGEDFVALKGILQAEGMPDTIIGPSAGGVPGSWASFVFIRTCSITHMKPTAPLQVTDFYKATYGKLNGYSFHAVCIGLCLS
jgi:hypothetical protein